MKILKIFALFSLFSNLLLFDANAVTHEKFKKQLKNTKDKINKLNKNSSKSKDVNVKNKTTSKTDTTCRQGKNFIFFGKTDKYVSAVGPEKFQVPQKIMFSHFSFLSQRPDKNYFVEYVFKPNGTVTATNMTTCKSMTYNWVFKERSSRIYLSRANRKDIQMTIYFSQSSRYKYKILFHSIGQYSNCYNYMNPQCNQLIAETLLVGFRDLKENKSYAQLKDAYFVKVAELKKKKEQERLAAQKKREAEIKAREDAERVRREKYEEQERKRQEAAKKKSSLFIITGGNIRIKLSKLYGD